MAIGFLFVGMLIIEILEIFFGVFLFFLAAYLFYQLVQKRKDYQQKRKDWLIRFSSI